MNRKLRNTILAFSVTGTVLALGLLAARPPVPGDGPMPAAMAVAATSQDPAPGKPLIAPVDLNAAGADGIEARFLARSREFERDMADIASLDSAMALTAGFVASATTEAVITEILARDIPATTGANRADPDADPAPRHRRSVRGAFAVPYFSFASGTGRGGRS
jgi:hypothetical protein